jgi:3-phosphoshikimate 1-carboxyvinyltransferase
MGLVAICGGSVTLPHFDFDSLQGEAQFYKVLEAMGCPIEPLRGGLRITRNGRLTALDVDMGNMPDVVQTLAAVACFAEGTTVMRNIAHLAFKESNRIVDTARELQKLGAKVDFGSDYLAVTGGSLVGTQVDTYDDHRMAMSLSLIGAKVPGVVINNAHVVSKSFPDYFDKLASIGIASRKL